jgi:hypothetical protein
MNRLLGAIALGATLLSTQAVARKHEGGMMDQMTRAQAQQMADSMFQRFDLNHDGIVTRQEAEQIASQFGGGGHAERMIDRLFGNNQSLTLQQAEAVALARFDSEDLNHDGVVTQEERQQARAMARAQAAGQPPAASAAPAPVPQNQ